MENVKSESSLAHTQRNFKLNALFICCFNKVASRTATHRRKKSWEKEEKKLKRKFFFLPSFLYVAEVKTHENVLVIFCRSLFLCVSKSGADIRCKFVFFYVRFFLLFFTNIFLLICEHLRRQKYDFSPHAMFNWNSLHLFGFIFCLCVQLVSSHENRIFVRNEASLYVHVYRITWNYTEN